jgi:DNA adenine methylase
MSERIAAALARARKVLSELGNEAVEKTIWGSPAGKKRLAVRLAKMLPSHRVYVEPFAGSAAVLFAKEPSAVEVINDADPEIADAYQLVKKLTPLDMQRLKKMPWTGDPEAFKRIYDSRPRDDIERLHRFLYVSHFSYGKLRGRSFSPSAAGVEAKTLSRIEQFAPRLRRVKVFGGDYEGVVRKFDGKDTAFFLDPPYPGYNVDVGESKFDEDRFYAVLKALKGKFLVTYGIRGKLPRLVKDSGFFLKRIRMARTIRAMRGVGGPSVLTQLLIANYVPAAKALAPDLELVDWSPGVEKGDSQDDGAAEPGPASAASTFDKATLLIKGTDPNDERFVLGIVLEPETVDAQGDIYSADEIRTAAHRFMEEFGGLGLMHRMRVNGRVKVLESYIAPADFTIGDVRVRKGTWLLAVHVLDDGLWSQVKDGTLTGFSIGGSARRVPEPGAERSASSETPPVEEAAA